MSFALQKLLPALLLLATQGTVHMIEYDVRPARSEYLSSEEIEITVRIANHSSDPIHVPDPEKTASVQPVHNLIGPTYPEGISFTNSHLLPPADTLLAGDPQLITIKPGGAWTGLFSLGSILDVSVPGAYSLTSKLNYEDVQAESQQSYFRVEPLQVKSVHLGLGTRPFEAAEGEGAFIQRGATASQIFSFTFKEMRPSIGEAEVKPPIHRFTAGSNASDIAVPWRNAPFFNEMLRWIVWREGNSIKALSSAARKPVSLDLPIDLARLVLPPLKATGGPVEVLALSQDESRLLLTEFTGQMGEEGSARLVWNSELPAHPAGITAALTADTASPYRHIAFVAERAKGFEIFHARYKPGAAPPSFQSILVPAARPLPNINPALFIEPDGQARVGVLTSSEADQPTVELVEAVFHGDAAPPELHPIHLGEMPGKITGAALLYVAKEGVLTRRDGLIVVEGNQLFKLAANEKLVSVTPGTLTSTILLAPGKQTTYVLRIDPARGLYIEHL